VISHNKITDLRTRNGGGIGILVADYAGGVVTENVVFQNTVSGTLHVDPNDGGGYQGSGIVLYADFRWGRAGAEQLAYNRVIKNKVGLVSDNPGLVDVVAFELTDSRDDPHLEPVIFDNAIGFNDFRGTATQIVLTPEELSDVNDISRNLGDNRGHGLHPTSFGPSLSWISYSSGSGTAESAGEGSKADCTAIRDGELLYSAGHYYADRPLRTGYDAYGYNYQAHMFNGTYANVYLGRYGYPPYYGRDDAYYQRLVDEGIAATVAAAAEELATSSLTAWFWPYRDVNLVMMWNDSWLSSTDCDSDGALDRHDGYPSYIGSGAWETNHQWGSYIDSETGRRETWNYFVKIIAVPADANLVAGVWCEAYGTEIGPEIWGAFAILQQVYNDTGTGEHGVEYKSPAGPGFGKW
jgi:hypothetical protein